jgi:ribokinase
MREVRILVVGSSVLDTVLRVEEFPKAGESVRASNVETFMGGKGSNQAVAAVRLGAQVTFAGAVGNDSAGHELVQRLRQEMVKCDPIQFIGNISSGQAFITLNNIGQNTIAVSLGANMAYDPEEAFRAVHGNLHDVLLLQGEIPIETSRAAAEISQGIVIFNPAPPLSIPLGMYEHIDYMTPNEHEIKTLTNIDVYDDSTAYKAGEELLQRGCRNVVITLGSKGAVYMNSREQGFIRAPKVAVVDTVGAGDCFNGSLAFALAQGAPIRQATQFAVSCASLSVMHLGAQTGMPFYSDLEDSIKGYLQNPQSA